MHKRLCYCTAFLFALSLAAFGVESAGTFAAPDSYRIAGGEVLAGRRLAVLHVLTGRLPLLPEEGEQRPIPFIRNFFTGEFQGFKSPYSIGNCSGTPCVLPEEKNKYVVGIFGDSTARAIGSEYAYLEKKLEANLKKEVVVMNFGGAATDPFTQAALFFYYRQILDSALFFHSGVGAARYPAGAALENKTARKQLFIFITVFSVNPLIKNSMTVHLVWTLFSNFLENGLVRPLSLPPIDADSLRWYILRQTAALRLIQAVSLAADIPALIVAVPDPLLPESKKLSPLEKENLSRFKILEKSSQVYAREWAAMDFRRRAIRRLDLTALFAGIPDDLWEDGLEPNERGIQMILDRVAESLENGADPND